MFANKPSIRSALFSMLIIERRRRPSALRANKISWKSSSTSTTTPLLTESIPSRYVLQELVEVDGFASALATSSPRPESSIWWRRSSWMRRCWATKPKTCKWRISRCTSWPLWTISISYWLVILIRNRRMISCFREDVRMSCSLEFHHSLYGPVNSTIYKETQSN